MLTIPLTRYTIQKLPAEAICTRVKIILDILNDIVRCVEYQEYQGWKVIQRYVSETNCTLYMDKI